MSRRDDVAKLLAKQGTRGPATFEQFHERADEIMALEAKTEPTCSCARITAPDCPMHGLGGTQPDHEFPGASPEAKAVCPHCMGGGGGSGTGGKCAWCNGTGKILSPAPAARRCKGCGKLIAERKVDRNLRTGVDEHWNDWEGTEIPGHPGWCGPVV